MSPERLITQLEITRSSEPAGSGMSSIWPRSHSTPGLYLVLAGERQHLVGHVEPLRPTPGAQSIEMRVTGDRQSRRLLGVQLVGHRSSEIAKRIDIPATAIFNEMSAEAISDLDLSYTSPLGSPWEAIQAGAQALLGGFRPTSLAGSPRR